MDTSERFIPPDIKTAFEYYPTYLRFTEKPKTPAEYVMLISGYMGKTGEERGQDLSDFMKWYGGTNFLTKLELFWTLYGERSPVTLP